MFLKKFIVENSNSDNSERLCPSVICFHHAFANFTLNLFFTAYNNQFYNNDLREWDRHLYIVTIQILQNFYSKRKADEKHHFFLKNSFFNLV